MRTTAALTLLLALTCDDALGFSTLPVSLSNLNAQNLLKSGLQRRSNHQPRYVTNLHNPELLPGIEVVNHGNPELFGYLESLREVPFFRLYSVDILASCEYMPQELFECYTEGCEILPVDEEEVPESIRGVDQREFAFDLDGWGRWDMPTEDYYDIQEYPEGYTGYDGADVWNFIHNRICFADGASDNWKGDFNKAVSGLHSMISAQVIRGIQEKLDNQEPFEDSEPWRDPRVEFDRRLKGFPLAIENLYFVFMLLLAAVGKARDRLLKECNTLAMDANSMNNMRSILQSPLLNHPSVSVVANKLQQHASASTHNLWEARTRTQDLLRIMNCVQCNKCRLHGKISTMGLSTALQLLVGQDGRGSNPEQIHRVELATLVTTLHKCSRAIQYCQSMQ